MFPSQPTQIIHDSSRQDLDIRLEFFEGEYLLVSSQLPEWQCRGATFGEVNRNCARSLRAYISTLACVGTYQRKLVASALRVKAVKMSDEITLARSDALGEDWTFAST